MHPRQRANPTQWYWLRQINNNNNNNERKSMNVNKFRLSIALLSIASPRSFLNFISFKVHPSIDHNHNPWCAINSAEIFVKKIVWSSSKFASVHGGIKWQRRRHFVLCSVAPLLRLWKINDFPPTVTINWVCVGGGRATEEENPLAKLEKRLSFTCFGSKSKRTMYKLRKWNVTRKNIQMFPRCAAPPKPCKNERKDSQMNSIRIGRMWWRWSHMHVARTQFAWTHFTSIKANWIGLNVPSRAVRNGSQSINKIINNNFLVRTGPHGNEKFAPKNWHGNCSGRRKALSIFENRTENWYFAEIILSRCGYT